MEGHGDSLMSAAEASRTEQPMAQKVRVMSGDLRTHSKCLSVVGVDLLIVLNHGLQECKIHLLLRI